MTAGLVLLDGCGDGDRDLATGWSFVGVVAVETAAASRAGGYGLRLGQAPANGLGIGTRTFPSSVANSVLGVHWHIAAVSPFVNEVPLIKFLKDGVRHFHLEVSPDNRVRLYGPAGTLVKETDPGLFEYALWYGLEVESLIHDSSGLVNVYLGGDSTPILSFTGDTKAGAATAFINQVQFLNGEQQRVYIDDLSVIDLATGTRQGLTFIKECPLDSDEETDWTPSTGTSHFAVVDERPYSATDYLASSNATDRDRFGTDDGGNTEEVLGARVVGQMQGTAGAQSRFVFSDGSTHATGATRSLGAAATYEDFFVEPPAGGAWGSSAGLQVGAEVVTGGFESRLNAIALELLLKRPPGEVRATSLQMQVRESGTVGAVDVTHYPGLQVRESGEPGAAHITHLPGINVLETRNASEAQVTHLYVTVIRSRILPGPAGDSLPPLLGICNMRNVIRAGEEESGIAAQPGSWKAVALEVFTYRRQLLQRLRMKYMDAEDGTVELAVAETIALPHLFSVDLITAHHIENDAWVGVNPVESHDLGAGTRPTFLLRDREMVLLYFSEDWDGIYDLVRVRGVPNPVDSDDWDNVTLVPNELLGPLFCTCLKLEAARVLCLREPSESNGGERASLILQERLRVERDLFKQGASMNRALSSRSTPQTHKPEA